MQQQDDRPKLINLLIQFQQKLQSHIKQKKYKQFLKSTIKLNILSQNIPRENPIISKQIIAFKLGLESKIVKCVEITLTYLNRLFEGKFIDINADDYSQNYIIGKDQIKYQEGEPNRQIRDMLLKTLGELVHFKNQNIDNLLIKTFEHLISEDVLTPILLMAERPNPSYMNLLISYFSFRFYYFEDTYLYTQSQADYINAYAPKSDRLNQQIKKAQIRHDAYQEHIGMYLGEIVTMAAQEGGKYGLCIICKSTCNNFCKDTKASVCSIPCKEQHINRVMKIEGAYLQSEYLFESIIDSLNQLFQFIKSQQKSILVLIELVESLLSRPYLFMVVKQQISAILYRQLPYIIACLYPQKNTKCQNLLFSLMGSIIHLYKHLFLSDIQQFFQLKILVQLQAKKPKLDSIISINKFLNNIFKNGQNFVELYLNLDMSLNRDNIIQKVMYQLGRILQDRFNANTSDYSKADKLMLKNESLNIHINLVQHILQIPYPKQYPFDYEYLVNQKNKKTSIQKFVLKFNDNINAGVKSLFNLNLITLDNQQQQTLRILKSTKGIKKSAIQQYFLQPKNNIILIEYIKQLNAQNRTLFQILINYFLILPLPQNLTYQKQGINVLNIFVQEYEKSINSNSIWDQVIRLTKLLKTSQNIRYQKFKESLEYQQLHFDQRKIFQLFIKIKGLHSPFTQSYQSKRYNFCNNQKYIQIIQGQINLIQISISHLLESQYEIVKTLELAKLLQELCPSSSNLFILIIKNTGFEYILSHDFTQENLLCINYLIQTPQQMPNSVFDWTPILKFYNEMFYFTLGACLTPITIQNKNKLLNSNFNNISINILKIANQLTKSNFEKYVIAMFRHSLNQMKYQRTFLLQKAFNIINTQIQLFMSNWESIFQNIRIVALERAHNQISFFCLNSIKENFTLVKKNLKQEQQTAYFLLFKQFYDRFPPLRESLLSAICQLVQSSDQLNSKTWKLILQFCNQYLQSQQKNQYKVYQVIEKIMASQLIFFLQFYQQIFILLKLLCNKNSKLSTRVLIDFQVLLEFLFKKIHKKLDTAEDRALSLLCSNLLEKLLPSTLLWLTNKFDSESFDTSIQVFFSLLKLQITDLQTNNKRQSYQTINSRTIEFLDLAFQKIVQRTKNHPSFYINAESFITQSVSVGARMRYFYILKCLSKTVYENFDQISFLAVKGIKTFIQILNPQTTNQWQNITSVLIEIMNASRTKNIQPIEQIKKQVCDLNIYELISQSKNLPDFVQLENISTIMNKLLIQKEVLQMLPNDPECLPLLKDIYKELRIINDNLPLRICLWKAGFGRGSTEIPSLLSLEDTVVSRILSIYSFHKFGQQYYIFASQTLQRYSKVCQQIVKVQQLLQSSDTNKFQYQMYVLLQNDYKKKRHLNEKFVRYLLPKLIDQQMTVISYQHKIQAKKIVGSSIIGLIGFFDAKTLLAKILRKLA